MDQPLNPASHEGANPEIHFEMDEALEDANYSAEKQDRSETGQFTHNRLYIWHRLL